MKKASFALLLIFVALPLSMTTGCTSDEPVVIEAPEMTPDEDAAYEKASMSSVDDESQN
ncbi:hypothetical protein [Rubripirellula reticaptiva]|uniref:Secreted protein n=1 Tax=Rubripirellula reticaptiva TaxID=2528013 RepID=A0A5C6FC71_9BACT|nr:hypothetical protein [Rubripirellula reticaptiva]TWU58217.1 hypothetical protein Poly59_11270 [Rubripirellula reticaptiva]